MWNLKNNGRKSNRHGGAMVFALGAIAVVGILIGAFLSQSQDWLARSKAKSSGQKMGQIAHANYERMLPHILQAWSWAMAVRAGSTGAQLPPAPALVEAYGGSTSTIEAQLRACQDPCVPDSNFLSHIFPIDKAAEEGWRYQVLPLQNGDLSDSRQKFPKRFSLTIFQSDKEQDGSEIRVTGQFVLAPTSLSAFGALAWALPSKRIILGEGRHDNIGLFMNLTDANGQPIALEEEDCVDTGEYNPGQAPNLHDGSIYLMPPAGKTLEVGILATNVDASRVCYGIDRALQYSFWWSHGNNFGDAKLKGVMTMGSVGQNVATEFRSRFSSTLAAIAQHNPLSIPSEAGVDGPGADQQNDYKESDEFSGDSQPFSELADISYYEAMFKEGKITQEQLDQYLAEYEAKQNESSNSDSESQKAMYDEMLVGGKIDQSEYDKMAEMYGWNKSEEPSKEGGEEKSEEEQKNEAAAAEIPTLCPADWSLQDAKLSLGACSAADSCSVALTERYTSACRGGEELVRTVYSGLVSNIPESYNQTLATNATRVVVEKGVGVSGNVSHVGLSNLTVMARGSFEPSNSIELHPDVASNRGSDPEKQGLLAFVNISEGAAAKISGSFVTKTGNSLAAIKSGGAAQPSATTVTAKFEAGFFALGSPTNSAGARPISMDSVLLDVAPSNNKTFGTMAVAGPQWGAELSSLRLSTPDMTSVVTGFARVDTSYPEAWTKSSVTDVENTKYLSYSEVSRSVEVFEGNYSGRVSAARDELGLQ